MSLARATFIVQLLEKLALPLVMSVSTVSMRVGTAEAASETQEAENVAAMITKATHIGVDLAKDLELQDDAQADAVRVALAAVASPLVAHYFAMNGKLPEDKDLATITSGFKTVLSFADHFTASDENTARMQGAIPNPLTDGQLSDEAQLSIQYLQVFMPVMNVVSVFPFGKSEQKLMQDIASRLVGRATTMRKSLFGAGLDDDMGRRADMYLLKSLADLYTACHSEETARLMATQDGQASIDPVWERFDQRSSMLETLVKAVVDVDALSVSPAASAPPPQASEAVVPQPVAAATSSPAEPVAEPAAASDNPMAFFGQPKEEGDTSAKVLGRADEAGVSAPAKSVEASAEIVSPQPAEATAAPAAPVEAAVSEEEGSDSAGSDNPMAFFAKPKEDDDTAG